MFFYLWILFFSLLIRIHNSVLKLQKWLFAYCTFVSLYKLPHNIIFVFQLLVSPLFNFILSVCVFSFPDTHILLFGVLLLDSSQFECLSWNFDARTPCSWFVQFSPIQPFRFFCFAWLKSELLQRHSLCVYVTVLALNLANDVSLSRGPTLVVSVLFSKAFGFRVL